MMPSRPARDAWIETLFPSRLIETRISRVPHGTRGLKRQSTSGIREAETSRPARDAWIETLKEEPKGSQSGSRPARDAWIETISGRSN